MIARHLLVTREAAARAFRIKIIPTRNIAQRTNAQSLKASRRLYCLLVLALQALCVPGDRDQINVAVGFKFRCVYAGVSSEVSRHESCRLAG